MVILNFESQPKTIDFSRQGHVWSIPFHVSVPPPASSRTNELFQCWEVVWKLMAHVHQSRHWLLLVSEAGHCSGCRESKEQGSSCINPALLPLLHHPAITPNHPHHHSAMLRAQSTLGTLLCHILGLCPHGDTQLAALTLHRNLPNLCRQGTRGLTQQK